MADEIKEKPKMLLIWNVFPEEVVLYAFDRKSKEAEYARGSNNCYIGGDELDIDHPLFELNRFLGTPEADQLKLVVSDEVSIRGKFSEVVICGQFL